MSECCVDASIAVKWFIKGETLRHKALQLLRDSQAAGITLIAPPVFEAETDSVIQTRVVDGRTTLDVADRTLALLDTAPVAIITHPRLRQRAREITRQFYQRKVYDATYAALAELRGCEFWTADKVLRCGEGRLAVCQVSARLCVMGTGTSYDERLQGEYGRLLREASAHFAGKSGVYQTLLNLARRLDEEGIPYAVIGGMALGRHGLVRMTEDVDVLMTAEGLAAFQARCVGKGYTSALAGARKTFRDTETQVRVEIITAGEYPGDGKRKPVVFPNPTEASVEVEGVRVVTLEKLIELKLASGMSAPHRLRDLADAQDLIGALGLPADFAEKLDASVRGEYRRLWQTTQEGKVDEARFSQLGKLASPVMAENNV